MTAINRPTPAQPWVERDDGTLDVLLYGRRTNVLTLVWSDCTDPTGWVVRAAWAASYTSEPMVTATSDGDAPAIALEVVLDDDDQPVGTRITITLTDEVMDAVAGAGGVWDVLAESPGGAEYPVIPSSPWLLWKGVAE